jgi:Growth inhibitor
MVNGYIPEKGDIVWLDFTPQAGHEQKGRRPALVVSPKVYNQKTGLGLFCPITSKEKGYPFEVPVAGTEISGCVLCDQIKSLDWTQRTCVFIEKCAASAVTDVLEKIRLLIV